MASEQTLEPISTDINGIALERKNIVGQMILINKSRRYHIPIQIGSHSLVQYEMA